MSCVILFITAVSLRDTLSLCQHCVAQTVLQSFCCTAVCRAGNKETKIYAICVYLGNMNSLRFLFYFSGECIECSMGLIWLSLPGKSQTADEFFSQNVAKTYLGSLYHISFRPHYLIICSRSIVLYISGI